MSVERLALDTNVLVSALDHAAPEKQSRAREVMARAARTAACVLSVQSIGELYSALRRRRLVPVDELSRAVTDIVDVFSIVDITPADARTALAAAASGRFAYWDALLLATLGRAGCTLLLSKDMRDGDTLAGVTVRNPFTASGLPPDLLARVG